MTTKDTNANVLAAKRLRLAFDLGLLVTPEAGDTIVHNVHPSCRFTEAKNLLEDSGYNVVCDSVKGRDGNTYTIYRKG